jgi:tight adherence protein C
MDQSAAGNDIWIVLASALAAAVSFALFAIPLIRRTERRERYRAVIEKKRKTLFEQTREELDRPKTLKADDQFSAAQSIALFYKLQKLAGEASVSARTLTQRAGIRAPNAPLVYLVSRIVLPLIFAGLGMMFISAADKEIPNGMVVLILMSVAMFGFFLPRIILKNSADKRQQEISLSFPDSLDMMLICVQGGIGIEAAINRIAETVADHSEALAEELGILSAELGLLNDRQAAFKGFAARVGSGPARSFANAMLQAEQYGTSVSKALRVLADESRDMRMAAAEQKAAALPPKLTVPMIMFFLPALFVVILGPAFMRGAG